MQLDPIDNLISYISAVKPYRVKLAEVTNTQVASELAAIEMVDTLSVIENSVLPPVLGILDSGFGFMTPIPLAITEQDGIGFTIEHTITPDMPTNVILVDAVRLIYTFALSYGVTSTNALTSQLVLNTTPNPPLLPGDRVFVSNSVSDTVASYTVLSASGLVIDTVEPLTGPAGTATGVHQALPNAGLPPPVVLFPGASMRVASTELFYQPILASPGFFYLVSTQFSDRPQDRYDVGIIGENFMVELVTNIDTTTSYVALGERAVVPGQDNILGTADDELSQFDQELGTYYITGVVNNGGLTKFITDQAPTGTPAFLVASYARYGSPSS